MKKGLLLVAVLALGFTACNKDEDEPTPKTTAELIIGTWMGDEVVTNIVAPPPIGNQTDIQDISFSNYNFKADGTYEADSAGVSMVSGTWKAPNSTTFVMDDTLKYKIQLLNASNFNFGLDTVIDFMGIMIEVDQTVKLKK